MSKNFVDFTVKTKDGNKMDGLMPLDMTITVLFPLCSEEEKKLVLIKLKEQMTDDVKVRESNLARAKMISE